MIEIEDRKYLYTLIPPDVAVRAIIFIIAYIVTMGFIIGNPQDSDVEEAWFWLFILILFTCAWFWFQIYVSKGYQASFDDEAIYLRPNGLGWNLRYQEDRIMRYDDIGEMFTSAGRTNMRPFEFIEIQRKNWDGSERFFLSRGFLRDHELKELLRFAQTKIPDKIPQDVIDYLEAEPSAREKRVMELTATHFPDGGRFSD